MPTRELCSGSVLQVSAAGASSLVVSSVCTSWGTYPGTCFRSKLARVNRPLIMMRNFFLQKCSINTYIKCSNVRLRRRQRLRSPQGSEPQQFRIIAHPKSNQLKVCSCVRNLTSGSSLVFPNLTLQAVESH